MRNEILSWIEHYTRDRLTWEQAPDNNKPRKVSTHSHPAVVTGVPAALRELLLEPARFEVKGSSGSANWAEVSWVVVRDPGVAPSTQVGYYVVYLLSKDGNKLYLSLNQGCSALRDEYKDTNHTLEELAKRAATMRSRVGAIDSARAVSAIHLKTRPSHRLGPFYEAGHVVGFEYECANLPDETSLSRDFKLVMAAYKKLMSLGGWQSAEEINALAEADGLESLTIVERKRYALHRTVERNRGAAKKIKKHYPDVCMGCDIDLRVKYGEALGTNMLDAHHLIPLHTLAEGTDALYRVQDFAVLCPSCHRAIHRLGAERLHELQALVKTSASRNK